MKRGKRGRGRKSSPKQSLNLPDLDHAKSAVLNSLPSKESQRGYQHAIDEFIASYCSEPRLSLNKAVVTRYRIHLESRQLAPGTINGRLAAVRRLAYEAADSGLLSPDLAAGIRRVKGPKNLGVRLGNWLTAEQARAVWQVPDPSTLNGKRDRALQGLLLGCGLRRREVAELEIARLQRREDHWAIVDLVGKGRHVRTVPVPDCVKSAIDSWLVSSGVCEGHVSVQTTERYLGCKQRISGAVNDRIGIEP
jgi:site-specific recombinase XerD